MCQSRRLLYRIKQFDEKTQCLQWGMADTKKTPSAIVFPLKVFLEYVGEEVIAKIVLHHHTLLRHSNVSYMFSQDETQFLDAIAREKHFLIEALSGEEVYPFEWTFLSLDAQSRLAWLDKYKQTLRDLAFPKALSEIFLNWIKAFSLRMTNSHTCINLPTYIPSKVMKEAFGTV